MVLDKFLFPTPDSTYTARSFADELVCVPGTRQGKRLQVPALLLYPTGGAAAAKFVVIYFHGNATDLGHMESEMRHLANQLSCAVLMPEYPGYGPFSTGSPSFDSINAAAWATFRFARDVMKVPSQRIVLYGRSIGTGVAGRLAARAAGAGERVNGVCLVSPYTNILHIVRAHAGFLACLFSHRWQLDEDLPQCDAPVLLLHGARDTLIEAQNSVELLKLLKDKRANPKHDQFLTYPADNGPHGHPVAVQIARAADHNNWSYTRDLLTPTVRFLRDLAKPHEGTPLPAFTELAAHLYSKRAQPDHDAQPSCFM